MTHIPSLDTSYTQLDTPALLVDIDVMDANIKRLLDEARASRISVRPHLKTGKTPTIAHRLLRAGAGGICVSKLGEAEVMAEAGIEDILITTEIVGEPKVTRLMALLRRHPELKVLVDSREGADALAAAAAIWGVVAKVLVEIDVGQGRCGTPPGEPALDLARHVARYLSLSFVGIQGYEGHLQHIPSPEERNARCDESMHKLTETVSLLRESGLPASIVTTGGTGTWRRCAAHRDAGVTEVQPGSFIFMDTDYRNAIGGEYGHALSVLATVISRPAPSRAIVDAGLKALSVDSGNAEPKNLPGVNYRHWGDEHGVLSWEEAQDPGLRVGDLVELVPSHCDTTVNLYDRYFVLRQGRLEATWEIMARGRSQ